MKKTALVLPLCLLGVSVGVSAQPALSKPLASSAGGDSASVVAVDSALTDCQRALLKVLNAEETYRLKHGSYRLTAHSSKQVRLITVPTFLKELNVPVDTANQYERESILIVVYHPEDTARAVDDSTLAVTFLYGGSIIGIATATYVVGSDSVRFEAHVLPLFRRTVVPLK